MKPLGPLSTCINEVALLIEDAALSSGTPNASRMTIIDFLTAQAIFLSSPVENIDQVIAKHAANVRTLLDELEEER